jgi:hypothetical protein
VKGIATDRKVIPTVFVRMLTTLEVLWVPLKDLMMKQTADH